MAVLALIPPLPTILKYIKIWEGYFCPYAYTSSALTLRGYLVPNIIYPNQNESRNQTNQKNMLWIYGGGGVLGGVQEGTLCDTTGIIYHWGRIIHGLNIGASQE